MLQVKNPRGEIVIHGKRFVVPQVDRPTECIKIAKEAGIYPTGDLAKVLKRSGYPVLPGKPYQGTGKNSSIVYNRQMLHPW